MTVQEQEVAVEDDVTENEQIAGYELREWIGDGAWSSIYVARQVSLDRTVVVKIMQPDVAADEARKKSILAQARRVARVSHTNLVCGLDVGEDEDRPYFVMEWAEGQTVEDYLRQRGRLPERQTLRLGAKIARALHAAHSGLLVHGAVRPRSMLVTAQGVPKLADLGPASLESARDLADAGHPSTAWYMSPEVARGETTGDAASDIYALGACLYHTLTGLPPFEGTTPDEVRGKHVMSPPPSLRAAIPGLSEATDAAVRRCLAKRASDRWTNGAELADALEAAAKGLVAATPPTAAPPIAPPGKKVRPPAGSAPLSRKARRRRR